MQPKCFALFLASFSTARTALLPSPPLALTIPTNASLSYSRQTSSPHPPFERINYLVPDTTTFISVRLYATHALPAMEVEIVLSAIEQQLTDHISVDGDGPLTTADDPYEFGIPGCFCSTNSATAGALSYGVLRDTMRGLHHVMVSGERFFVAYYDVTEGKLGGRKLGAGEVLGEGIGTVV